MPKMKTKSAAKKRFKKTGTGKIRRSSSLRRHILTKKSPKRKRQLRKGGYVHAADMKRVKGLLPN